MGKDMGRVGLLGLVLMVPHFSWGNSFFDRVPTFDLPQGAIAFMGCYWSPLTILGNGVDPNSGPPAAPGQAAHVYHSGNFSVGFDASKMVDLFSGEDPAPPTSQDATAEANQAVLEKGAGMGLTLAAVNYSTVYQNALLMHILSPAKWAYNPRLTQYGGNKPYLLIGIIDHCGVFPGPTKIREKQNDQPIRYFGKRSILEQDEDVFANKKALHTAAVEFFLVSTVDGNTLWQGNVLNSAGNGNNYSDLLRGVVENALKNLAKK